MKFKKCFVIAPSGEIDRKHIDLALTRLKKVGFKKIYYRDDVLDKYFDYAGSYKRRIDEIHEAYSSDAEIIFCFLGGQGAIHLVDKLDYNLIKNSKKILVGLSDITLLLNSINQKTGNRCLHGPNIGKSDDLQKETIDYLIKSLNRENFSVIFNEEDILVGGFAEGKIVGGNIELLGRSLGTPFEIKTDNKILFLEEYKMPSWRVFDILHQLKVSGKFDHVKGVILGYFTECGEDIIDYIREFFKDFKVPVILNQQFGHSEPNIIIPIGEKGLIDTNNLIWKVTYN